MFRRNFARRAAENQGVAKSCTKMRQLALARTGGWGGKRRGAGRKPKGDDPLVSHARRPDHDAGDPVHVTLRTVVGIDSLRDERVYSIVENAIERSQRASFSIAVFSVQQNHVHLIVEADDRQALIRGIHGMTVRLAIAINRALRRRGKVWADRYHARALHTPTETRNAVAYVVLNYRKHLNAAPGFDPRSSACWFDGWTLPPPPPTRRSPVRPPRTWLLRVGWRKRGLISPSERPSRAA